MKTKDKRKNATKTERNYAQEKLDFLCRNSVNLFTAESRRILLSPGGYRVMPASRAQ